MNTDDMKLIEPIEKIAQALAKAKLTNPPKTKTAKVVSQRTGAKFEYHYADLSVVIEHVRPALSEVGLVVTQIIEPGLLVTRLIHESGQSLTSRYKLPELTDSQAMGSAITYARRYSLCAILGIAAEDDEDGGKATDAENNLKEEEEEAKREEARRRLEEAKAQGRVKDVYSGKTLAPGQEPNPEAKPEPKQEKQEPPKDDGIAPELKALMVKDGIDAETVKAFYLSKRHYQNTMEVAALPADYIKLITREDNWLKVKAFARKGV
jgi:hypothetical protein